MKKLFLLILLISLTTVFGQTLKFDIFAKYSISHSFSHKNTTTETSAFAISSNDNYIMKFLNDPGIQKPTANVYDLKSLKIYEFYITELKTKNGEINYKFTYSNTYKIAQEPVKDLNFDFQRVSKENDIETVKLFFYKNKSKTKISNTLELKILESKANLFPLFRFICFHLLGFTAELNYPNAGLVTHCVSENGLSEYRLTAFEETSLELTLPN